ncbi:MAG: rRNA maturation RNase YbeY [Angustibacter sp.]
MGIELNNESGVPVDSLLFVELARFVLANQRVNPYAELSLVLVEEEAMAQLHEQWMDLPGPTDVLSFPMDELRPGSMDEGGDDGGLLGDVVLCPTVAARQAHEAGHPVLHELLLLTTHGILHLLGYDHAEPEEKDRMFRLQDELLAEFLQRGDSTSS